MSRQECSHAFNSTASSGSSPHGASLVFSRWESTQPWGNETGSLRERPDHPLPTIPNIRSEPNRSDFDGFLDVGGEKYLS